MIGVKENRGFTLVELLVVAAIIGILISLTLLGFGSARRSQRDAQRKTNLEIIRSGIELYKSDCDAYPLSLPSPLVGDDSTSACSSANEYISEIPVDPLSPTREYVYSSSDGLNYELCAALEGETSGSVTCGATSSCGDETCNYKTVSP